MPVDHGRKSGQVPFGRHRASMLHLSPSVATALAAVLMGMVVFLVYAPAWRGGLIWDDDAHVTRPELRSLHGLYRIWFEIGATQQYYPLTHSVFWVEHRFWGDSTLGYHLVNILLHCVAAMMVWRILRRLAIPGAWLAAMIFAVHPVHVESVAWITELKNTLSGVFYLGSMLCYLRFDQQREARWYIAAFVLFALGLASKTVTATLPAALMIVFWWRSGRLTVRRDILPLVPFFAIGCTAGILTSWVESALIGASGAAFDLSLVQRSLIAGRAIWFYLWKLLWPGELIFVYPRWRIDVNAPWQYLFPLAVAALLVVLWKMRGRSRAPLAAVLFFAGTLFPVLGFFNVYPFVHSFVADHFQYLASLGIITLFSAGMVTLLDRLVGSWRVILPVSSVVMIAFLGSLTWQQSRQYTDIETLYRKTLNKNPSSWMAHYNLGNVFAGRGQVDAAIVQYRGAVAACPGFVEAHNNLASVLVSRGQMDEAIAQYRAALKLDPAHAEAHYNLGTVLAGLGQTDEAIARCRLALKIKPDYAKAHLKLATLLEGRRLEDESRWHYVAALRLAREQNRPELEAAVLAKMRLRGITTPANGSTSQSGRKASVD